MSDGVFIRRAGKDDAAALASLHRSCFAEAWSSASFEALLGNEHTFALAAIGSSARQECDALIVTSVAADQAEILTLGTAPAMRRTGLARALVLAASAEAHSRGAVEIFLEVADNNAAAAALYSSMGFSVAGERMRYYRDGTNAMDAKIMRASLPLAH